MFKNFSQLKEGNFLNRKDILKKPETYIINNANVLKALLLRINIQH